MPSIQLLGRPLIESFVRSSAWFFTGSILGPGFSKGPGRFAGEAQEPEDDWGSCQIDDLDDSLKGDVVKTKDDAVLRPSRLPVWF